MEQGRVMLFVPDFWWGIYEAGTSMKLGALPMLVELCVLEKWEPPKEWEAWKKLWLLLKRPKEKETVDEKRDTIWSG